MASYSKMAASCLALSIFFNTVFAVSDTQSFKHPSEQKRFSALTQQLRCLVCQNQNLADSNAPLAKDLREQVANMIRQGNNNVAIKQQLVSQYGDFVLYKPPVQKNTWLLWFGPLVLLGLGLLIGARVMRAYWGEH